MKKNYGVSNFWNQPEAGNYIKDKIFGPGKKLYWNDMIEQATGEKLTAKYFVEQYIK